MIADIFREMYLLGDLLFSINSKSMSCEFMYSFNKQKAPSIFLQTKCYGTLIFNNSVSTEVYDF